jgi:outer membrane lipoprotein SlyB
MNRNTDQCLAAAAMLALCLAAPAAHAADAAVPEQSSVITRCSECGMVYNIRRVEKPVAPGREQLPNTASSPAAGGVGNETQAVPLISFGQGGAQRVQREPVTHSVWELTVRYDNGQFGLVTQENQPEFKVGDRVRRVDNTFEPIPQPGR